MWQTKVEPGRAVAVVGCFDWFKHAKHHVCCWDLCLNCVCIDRAIAGGDAVLKRSMREQQILFGAKDRRRTDR